MNYKIISIEIQREAVINDLVKTPKGFYYVMSDNVQVESANILNWKPQQLVLLSNDMSYVGEWTVFTDFHNDVITGYNLPKKAESIYASNNFYNFKVLSAFPVIDGLPMIPRDFLYEWMRFPVEKVYVLEGHVNPRNERFPDYLIDFNETGYFKAINILI